MEQMRNSYRILIGKPEGKILLARHRRRWEDNIKKAGVNWIHLI
jgi:hypothetical protein